MVGANSQTIDELRSDVRGIRSIYKRIQCKLLCVGD